jgi:iron complex outermembrane recepter protein
VNLGAGVTLPSKVELAVYVTNLLDENVRLAFDRERGGRARLGFSVNQPRTIGITARKAF